MSNTGLDVVYNQVEEFHKSFGHPVSEKPTTLSHQRKLARATWMREEVNEFMDAETIVDSADAMIDLIYFAVGTLVEMGISKPQGLMNIVQNANMSKLWSDGEPHFREDGKVIKPVGWEAPESKMEKYIESL